MNRDLLGHYHRRTDHGRDGMDLDGFTCNCRALFEEYARELLAESKSDARPPHPDTQIAGGNVRRRPAR